jgi:hypothetical protein
MISGQAWRDTSGDTRGEDVACSDFLARHSAWLDGELDAAARAAHERHLAACDACSRYARVLTRGTELLRGLPEVEPSEEFGARLQHRLFHVEDERLLAGRRTGRRLATAALVCAVAASPFLGEWISGARAASGAGMDPALAHPHEDVFPNRTVLWEPAAVPVALHGTPASFRETGYTPVVIRPPQYRPGAAAVLGD